MVLERNFQGKGIRVYAGMHISHSLLLLKLFSTTRKGLILAGFRGRRKNLFWKLYIGIFIAAVFLCTRHIIYGTIRDHIQGFYKGEMKKSLNLLINLADHIQK